MAHRRGATRHAREARCRPQPRHKGRCQATKAAAWRQTRGAHTSRNKPRHRNRCQATGNPQTMNPSQGSRGAVKSRAQTHTPTPHTPARTGRYRRSAHTSTHTPQQPRPGVAGRSQNQSPNIHTHTAHSSQEWQGTSRARTPAHTHPNTPAKVGGAQLKPEPKHTHPRRTPQPGVAGYERSTHTNTHTPKPQPGVAGHSRNPSRNAHSHIAKPSHEWGVQAEHAHQHTHTPPGVAGRSRNPSGSTHTHTAHPGQEWRGTRGVGTQTRTS